MTQHQQYIVVPGSQSAHCCFDFTVVDTARPVLIDGQHFENRFESVCECFHEEDARLITAALNAARATRSEDTTS